MILHFLHLLSQFISSPVPSLHRVHSLVVHSTCLLFWHVVTTPRHSGVEPTSYRTYPSDILLPLSPRSRGHSLEFPRNSPCGAYKQSIGCPSSLYSFLKFILLWIGSKQNLFDTVLFPTKYSLVTISVLPTPCLPLSTSVSPDWTPSPLPRSTLLLTSSQILSLNYPESLLVDGHFPLPLLGRSYWGPRVDSTSKTQIPLQYLTLLRLSFLSVKPSVLPKSHPLPKKLKEWWHGRNENNLIIS